MEINRSHILSFPIDNESDIGICRRKAAALASQIGFNQVKTGEIAIIVTELVTNVLKHGGGKGKLVMCQLESSSEQRAIEIWCCDQGTGIPDFKKAIQDGYSEASSLGLGLGSIRRFSDELEINPEKSQNADSFLMDLDNFGNCIRSRKWLPVKQWVGINHRIQTGASSRCKPGEKLNGDAYVVNYVSNNVCVGAVIDGLGHGKEANMASQLARQTIIQKAEQPLDVLMQTIHQSIRGTRGTTIGLVSINTEKESISFSGIGNIESFLINKKEKKNLLSFGGIMGHNMRTPRVFEFPFKPGDFVVMYSDGITSRWKPEELDWSQTPQKNAEYILNQFARSNDDATVLIIGHSL
jgi:anti-sigma regulatory factor (Ser/Thr protein kinase)/serine/threonine protein phosphatase PrpC